MQLSLKCISKHAYLYSTMQTLVLSPHIMFRFYLYMSELTYKLHE